jgi:hypothetical protein
MGRAWDILRCRTVKIRLLHKIERAFRSPSRSLILTVRHLNISHARPIVFLMTSISINTHKIKVIQKK